MKTHTKKKQYRRMVQALQQRGQVNRPDGSWGPAVSGLSSHTHMTGGSTHGGRK